MIELPSDIRLKKNSWIAQLAALKLGSKGAALVLGNTIHLFKISKEEFLSNPRLVRHEVKHIEQYKRLGLFRFLIQYLWFTIRWGYYKNPLEIEAREAENRALAFEKKGNFLEQLP